MSTVDFRRYTQMLDRALTEGFAYPAINVLETTTLNAALEGFAAARSDGIIQVSVAAGVNTSGALADPVLGAITLAEHARRLADRYDINIAIHTDHCPPSRVESFLQPLLEETARRRGAGLPNLFNSHMFDGSDAPLTQNLEQSLALLKRCRDNEIILEIEVGVVGGEEDGVDNEGLPNEKLYTTPEDMVQVYETLGQVEGARYLVAATFGNVHGVYKPGSVVLKPQILKDGQDAVMAKYGADARLWLVFHGGSGSTVDEIHESIHHGVVKMNIHTDTQYAFTRGVADHMFKRYDGVLRIEGEVGTKQDYLASTWLDKGKEAMIARVVEACDVLKSTGKTMGRS